MRKSQRIPQIVLLFATLVFVGGAQLAHADEIAAPPVLLPILGPPADRFTPTDVAAAPPPSGLLSPAPPAFQRWPCQAGACGAEVTPWITWGPQDPTPSDLPGAPPSLPPAELPGMN